MNEWQACALLGIVVFTLRRTDALYWYGKSFGLIDAKYLKARKEGRNYLDWLNSKHDNFFTELLVCPFCMSTWLAIIPSLIFEWSNYPYYWSVILMVYGFWAALKSALNKYT